MTEFNFNKDKKGWVYVGRKKNGEAKFRKFTNQTEEHVKQYLDGMGIAYMVIPRVKMFFIYKDKQPTCRYSPRYSYYYTTGQWGGDKRQKHYHSEGIEHFMGTHYKTTEEEAAFWADKKGETDEHT
tara:strand:+ start:1525 stop:1902 length:378 start_codon:yes stop_codon:yes gene_type:complete